MIWIPDGRNFYSVVKTPDGRAGLCLYVEQLPNRSWHWAVWNPRNGPKAPHQGTAETAEAARGDAELLLVRLRLCEPCRER
jgi:hypothetical protein